MPITLRTATAQPTADSASGFIRRQHLGSEEFGAVRAKSIDKEKHSAEFVIATEAPVRDSYYAPPTSLLMSGVNLQDYRSNPVVLAQHENGVLEVVGRTEKVWPEAGEKRGQGVLVARAVFDVDDELGKRIWGKIERGFLRAASAGFVVTRTRLLEEGREDRDTGFAGPVRFATAWRLLEWSVVGVGADPAALGRQFPEPEVEAAGDRRFSLRGSLVTPPAFRLSTRA